LTFKNIFTYLHMRLYKTYNLQIYSYALYNLYTLFYLHIIYPNLVSSCLTTWISHLYNRISIYIYIILLHKFVYVIFSYINLSCINYFLHTKSCYMNSNIEKRGKNRNHEWGSGMSIERVEDHRPVGTAKATIYGLSEFERRERSQRSLISAPRSS
jgi:hypothetical protein